MARRKILGKNVIRVDFGSREPDGPRVGAEELELIAAPFFMLFEQMARADPPWGGYKGPLDKIVERESLGLFPRKLSDDDAHTALDELQGRGLIEWKRLLGGWVQVDFTDTFFDWIETH